MYEILIIDDEPMICNGLKAIISQGNFPIAGIQVAFNGLDALSLIEQAAPDIMITDIRMPKMDGVALLTEIRKRHLNIRVLVLSGYDDFEYVKSMAVLGIENYLLKPVDKDELFSTIDSTIRKLDKEVQQLLQTRLTSSLIKENIINRWIYGSISEHELTERADFLKLNLEASYYQPCIIRLLGNASQKDFLLKQEIYDICVSILSSTEHCYYSKNYNGDAIAIFYFDEPQEQHSFIASALNLCLETIARIKKHKAYVLLGKEVDCYANVATSFEDAATNGIHLNQITTHDIISDGATDNSNTSPFSLKLAAYVLEHYDADLSLKTLASHFKGNAAYIGQIFKRDIHKSFSEYLKHVRIEKAKELLIRSNENAKEIAQQVGFQNNTYFTTVFKEETGLSPAEYKKTFSHRSAD